MSKFIEEVSKIDFINEVEIKISDIEAGLKRYKSKILSIHNKKLTVEEEKNFTINEIGMLNSKEENKFIDFMQKAYELNNNKGAIIDFYINRLDDNSISNIAERLEGRSKELFLEIVKEMSGDTVYFKVLDKEIIELITKLNTRELFFCTVYFLDTPLTVWGNYNLEFPIFYKEEEGLETYKELIDKSGLYYHNV